MKWSRRGAWVVLMLTFGTAVGGEPAGDVATTLHEIDRLRAGRDTDIEALEARCRAALGRARTDREVGSVYVALTAIHAQSGLRQPARVATYAEEALHHDLSPAMKAQTFVYWADALELEALEARGDTFRTLRQDATVVALRGLRWLMSQNVPARVQPLPVVQRVGDEGASTTAEEAERRRRNEQEIAARERVVLQNRLVEHRAALEEKCLYLYSMRPIAYGELERTVLEVTGSDELSARLVQLARARPVHE